MMRCASGGYEVTVSVGALVRGSTALVQTIGPSDAASEVAAIGVALIASGAGVATAVCGGGVAPGPTSFASPPQFASRTDSAIATAGLPMRLMDMERSRVEEGPFSVAFRSRGTIVPITLVRRQ